MMGDVLATALARAIRSAFAGGVVLPTPLAAPLAGGRLPEADSPTSARDKRLSPREIQVLRRPSVGV